MTTGAAYAQSVVPDATGTVTCLQVDTNMVVTTVTYPVDWYYGTNLDLLSARGVPAALLVPLRSVVDRMTDLLSG